MAYTEIDDPSAYFQTLLYTSNNNGGSPPTLALTNSGNSNLQPDWVWIKSRTEVDSHSIYDSVRGTGKEIISNTTGAESTSSTSLTAFGSNGFTVGTDDRVRRDHGGGTADKYAAWQWKAGTSVSGTTSGSGTGKAYSGSVSTTAGFSIIKYLGNGTAGHTIPHHLGAVPKFIIVKQTIGGDENWFSYHVSLGNTKDIHLNQTNAAATADSWNDTTPTSSVFSISDQSAVNGNGNTHVGYLFSEKKGYSKFGSYIGNGSTNGTYVHLGFKPALTIIKNSGGTGPWYLFDNKRPGFNVINVEITANSNDTEATDISLDHLSNGFKLRKTGSGVNGSGNSYIYMAFAESPFVTGASAIPTTAR